MKLALMLPNYARWFRGDGIWATCEKAKELDFDGLCFVDHVMVTPTQYVGYGNGYMDIWTAMSYVAAVTNIQGWKPILTQGVVVIPYRPAIQQAKIAATVDSLSGGRLMLGVGSGYNENEFRSLSLNVRERGDITDEYLACMKELWTHPVSSYHGKYVNYDEMTISVRPSAQPHPPIIYGSHGARPRRRIAERYQGNFEGPGSDAESMRTFESNMADLNRLWKEHGRTGKPYLVSMARGHLSTERGGTDVVKGLASPNLGTPETITAGGQTYQRFAEGTERSYVSRYIMTHVDDFTAQLKRLENAGTDLAIVWLPSYRFGGMDNLGMQLRQMEIFAEHVLPKVSRDKKPIEMDFGGKTFTPLATS